MKRKLIKNINKLNKTNLKEDEAKNAKNAKMCWRVFFWGFMFLFGLAILKFFIK